MISFADYYRFEQIDENILDHLAGGSHGHYGHIPDNVYHGAHAAVASHKLFNRMVSHKNSASDITPQKKTDGSVSVVTVRNHKDSPFHNPKYPEHAVGVAYKGRMDAKTIDNKNKVSYSKEDIANNYGKEHHLTPVLSKLLDHAHKIHGDAHIIQHDIHSTDPKKDIHYENGVAHWQPNTIRNSTSDKNEIAKLKKSKLVLASHTKFDKNFEHGSGLGPKDLKHHSDVYNVNLTTEKPNHTSMSSHLSKISSHLKSKEARNHLDTVGKASYNNHLERFTNSKVNAGEYGNHGQNHLKHSDFKAFVAKTHDKEIEKAKSVAGKAKKTEEKNKQLADIDKDKNSIEHVFKTHHVMTNAVRDYVNHVHKSDNSPIKHELPDGKGGFTPAPFEGVVPRGSHPKVNSQKFNDRAAFNRMNKINGEMRFGSKKNESLIDDFYDLSCLDESYITNLEILDESLKNFQRNSDHAVMTLGRFSPFHNEHNSLVDAVKEHAAKNKADPHIFTTHSHDNDKNPLTASEKMAVMRKARPDLKKNIHSTSKESPSIFHVLSDLHKKGYKKATVVLGDDRTEELHDKLHSYNGKFDKNGRGYKFDQLHIISRHDIKNTRNKEGGDGVHASDIRKAALRGDSEFMHKNMSGLSHGMVRSVMDRIKARTVKK